MLRLGPSLRFRSLAHRSLNSFQTRSAHSFPTLSYDITRGVPPVFSAVATKKHFQAHQDLFTKLNFLVEGTGDENKSLEELMLKHYNLNSPVYNQAAETFNHNWMWQSVTPGGSPPSDWMLQVIGVHFGSKDRFDFLWNAYANAVHGSGWVWLVDNNGHLEIAPGFNAGNPIGKYKVLPLLACDVWEHAYFHDFGIERKTYIKKWLGAINWEFVEETLKRRHPNRNFVTREPAPEISGGLFERVNGMAPGQYEESHNNLAEMGFGRGITQSTQRRSTSPYRKPTGK